MLFSIFILLLILLYILFLIHPHSHTFTLWWPDHCEAWPLHVDRLRYTSPTAQCCFYFFSCRITVFAAVGTGRLWDPEYLNLPISLTVREQGNVQVVKETGGDIHKHTFLSGKN